MDGPGAEVLAAHEARTAYARLSARIARARAELAAADEVVAAARARLDAETEDVVRLESFSPSRIWAGLRGSRDADLDRERAEQQQAAYAAAAADARRATALEEVQRAEAERLALGNVEKRWTAALSGLDAWLAAGAEGAGAGVGGQDADELRDVTVRLAATRSEAIEVLEARQAALRAAERLAVAVDLLSRARSWANLDTFGGGGALTDLMKYDRMDQASEVLRGADRALLVLRDELADVAVDLPGVGPVDVSGLEQTLDLWFDNFFSDLTVRARVREAQQRTDRAVRTVRVVLDGLEQRRAWLAKDDVTLSERQAELALRLAH